MKLEDCTKEELIYFIKRNAFVDIDRLEFDVLMHRSDAAFQKSKRERDFAIKALGEYAETLRPYEGKPMVSIPDDTIKRATTAWKRYEQHSKSAERHDKQYRKIQEQIDVNLNRKGIHGL